MFCYTGSTGPISHKELSITEEYTYLEDGADWGGDGGEDVLEERDLLLAAGVLRRLGQRMEEVGVVSGKTGLFTEEIRTKIQRRQLPVRAPFNVFNALKQEDNRPTWIG